MLFRPKQRIHLLPIISIFSVIKRFDLVPLYGQLLMPLIGLFHLVTKRKVLAVSLPLFLMIGFNLITWATNGFPTDQITRLVQLFFIIMFFNSMCLSLNDQSLKIGLRMMAILSLCFFVGEFTFVGPKHFRYFWGINFFRYDFIVGEVNYSGLLFFGLFLLSSIVKERLCMITFFVLSFATLSRGVFIAYLVFIFLILINRMSHRLFLKLSIGVLVLFFVYPLIIIQLNKHLPKNIGQYLSSLTPRYYIHGAYSEQGIKTLLGAGYFQSQKQIRGYLENHKQQYSWLEMRKVSLTEVHSLQVQVLSNFGIIGYLFFVFFIAWVFFVLYLGVPYYTAHFLSILAGFSFLNGLNEWIFYFFIAYCLSTSGAQKKLGLFPLVIPFLKKSGEKTG